MNRQVFAKGACRPLEAADAAVDAPGQQQGRDQAAEHQRHRRRGQPIERNAGRLRQQGVGRAHHDRPAPVQARVDPAQRAAIEVEALPRPGQPVLLPEQVRTGTAADILARAGVMRDHHPVAAQHGDEPVVRQPGRVQPGRHRLRRECDLQLVAQVRRTAAAEPGRDDDARQERMRHPAGVDVGHERTVGSQHRPGLPVLRRQGRGGGPTRHARRDELGAAGVPQHHVDLARGRQLVRLLPEPRQIPRAEAGGRGQQARCRRDGSQAPARRRWRSPSAAGASPSALRIGAPGWHRRASTAASASNGNITAAVSATRYQRKLSTTARRAGVTGALPAVSRCFSVAPHPAPPPKRAAYVVVRTKSA